MTEKMDSNWEKTFIGAQDNKSPTFTKTMDVSLGGIGDIEKYLEEQGDSISAEEKDFLKESIESKEKQGQRLSEDTEKASLLKEEIVSDIDLEKEASKEIDSSALVEIRNRITKLNTDIEKYKVNGETIIKSENETSRFKKRYSFDDKSASKSRFWLFGGNKKGELYEMIGSTAESLGIDLSNGKSVNEIMDLLEEKA